MIFIGTDIALFLVVPIKHKKYRVLVSEREKNTREAVTEILSDAGYTVEQAASGSETIEMLARQAYDLILCDLDMPRRSGLEIVRMARALNTDARIVVTSSLGDPAAQERMRDEGAFEYLDKPLRKSTLLAVARRALRGRGSAPHPVGSVPEAGRKPV